MDCGGFSGCMLFTTVETIFFAFKAIELGGVVCFIDFWIEFVGWIIYGTKLSRTLDVNNTMFVTTIGSFEDIVQCMTFGCQGHVIRTYSALSFYWLSRRR